ncbi:F-box/RNI-like superfamily protein [Prunus dulcis]|uniref:F-box/RNI-like superfamily protein n=1 Tax=Prunus dulcis TaxID=3755 RepID=A0A4Y1RVW8_PRUDU|nr:F-box/RNI-like superfamily protein [Prunus dulcis]
MCSSAEALHNCTRALRASVLCGLHKKIEALEAQNHEEKFNWHDIISTPADSTPGTVLVVSLCEGLKGIELSATNLTSFHYKGDDIELAFERVPNLGELYVMMKDTNVVSTFAQLEKELPHVKSMTVAKSRARYNR